MKNPDKTNPVSLNVNQWREVFARVDGLLESQTTLLSEDDGLSISRRQVRDIGTDGAVNSVVHRWSQSTSAPSGSSLQLGDDALLTATALTQPRSDLVLGNYRLLERIGQGGMGSVWRAERTDGLYEAQVAIKLLGSLALSAHARARFAQEGQILARLTHPNIAGLLDAGITGDNQRYLVIELIEGVSLNEYVLQKQLNLNERLHLLRQLLDAVAFAHERLVIHRDIKPANILVTATGALKLLDFGVAKLLVEQTGDASLTQVHGAAYTEAYAAPEQIRGDPPTILADVFSLGMILLELISGQRVTWARPKRGLKAGDQPETLGAISPPDLRAILGKALEVAPEDRYRSVAALDDDVRRFLASEPVLAHSAGASYGLIKFVRRNKLGVGATAAVMMALIVGASVATWQWREANAQAERSRFAQSFMVGVVQAATQGLFDGQGRMALENVSAVIEARAAIELKDQPDVQPEMAAKVQAHFDKRYSAIGERAKALPQIQNIILRHEQGGPVRQTDYFNALFELIEIHRHRLQFDDVLQIADKLRASAKAALGEPNVWLGPTIEHMAWAREKLGDSAKAASLTQEASVQHKAYTSKRYQNDPEIASRLVESLISQGNFVEAREVASSRVREGPHAATNQLLDSFTLAYIDYALSRNEAAVIRLQPLVDEMGKFLGVRHLQTVQARSLLARSLVAAGFTAAGVSVQRDNVFLVESRDRPNDDYVVVKQKTTALGVGQKTVHTVAMSDMPDDRFVADERLVLAKLLVATGRPEEAEVFATQALNFLSVNETPFWNRERARWILSDAQMHQRRFRQADENLANALKNMALIAGFETHPLYAGALQTRALLRRASGQIDDAAKDISVACEIFDKKFVPSSMESSRCKLYAMWIVANQAAAMPPPTFVRIKEQMLRLIPATHESYQALLAILRMIEQPNVAMNEEAKMKPIWPISLADAPH